MSFRKNSKIKWCFLIASCPYVMEFFGKLAEQIIKRGDECILVVSSKIAEYSKLEYFPKNIKVFSKVDWARENYQKNIKGLENFSWKDIFSDFVRNKLYKENYQDWLRIASQTHQFIDFVFRQEKPDVVLHEIPGSIFPKIAYLICQKYNINYLGFVHSRLPGQIDIYDSKYTCSKYEKIFKELGNNISAEEKNFARAFVESFVSHRKLPNYVHYQVSHPNKLSLKEYLKKQLIMSKYWFKYLLKRKDFRHFDYESERLLKYWLRYPKKALRWRIKALLSKKIFRPINEKDNFFLFPLHVQPEYSTGAMASYFYNQLNTITNIAFALPFPFKLYVKEHPLAFEGRSKDFYQAIKRIPNVVFVSPKEKTESLIKKSAGVIVLTSTVGLEAVLAGKPVYALGDVFYYYHPLCRKVNSFEELKQKIEQDLTKKPYFSDLENINIRFALSYFKGTIPGDIFAASSDKDTNNYRLIYEDIKRIFL